jgi:hypothetical protein
LQWHIFVAMSCAKFPTQFGYIDPAKTQTLAVDISPFSEGAPGDTLHLSAYFAGDSAKTYTCSLSTQYIQNGLRIRLVLRVRGGQ